MENIYGWIPQHLGNRVLLHTFEALRRAGAAAAVLPSVKRRRMRNGQAHFEANTHTAQTLAAGYLEHQRQLSGFVYGKTDLAAAGCEIIAMYDLLLHLGRKEPLPALIREAESAGMVRGALWGTSPKAVVKALSKRGLTVHCAVKEPDFDETLKTYDSFLLTLYNDEKDLRRMVHTVLVTREGDGLFCIHNAQCDGALTAKAQNIRQLMAAFPGGRAKAILLAGVRI
ncbi:MAG: hypothetical protein LKJ76_00600 [Lachnospiraceae bacterium]|jgi:hypothetical protein|nr:hypothetical protein [Lachnospiraceae bacterium]